MPFITAVPPAASGISPSASTSTAPPTAHTASGHLNGRMITPAVARATMLHASSEDIRLGQASGQRVGGFHQRIDDGGIRRTMACQYHAQARLGPCLGQIVGALHRTDDVVATMHDGGGNM